MGNRAQVHVYGYEGDVDVYLYTHWGAQELPMVVRNALKRVDSPHRFKDGSYIARIIFSEMIKDDIEGSTGFGIDNVQHGDVWRVITVDTDRGVVEFEGYPSQDFDIMDYIDPEFAPDIESIPDTRLPT
jgi:hypothetical protein